MERTDTLPYPLPIEAAEFLICKLGKTFTVIVCFKGLWVHYIHLSYLAITLTNSVGTASLNIIYCISQKIL